MFILFGQLRDILRLSISSQPREREKKKKRNEGKYPSTSCSMNRRLDCGQKSWNCINIHFCLSSCIPELCFLFLAWERTPQSFTCSREATAPHCSCFHCSWYSGFSVYTKMDVIRGVEFLVSHVSFLTENRKPFEVQAIPKFSSSKEALKV